MRKRDELTNPAGCMFRAKDDEMTFVLLGRDEAAPDTIRDWIARRIKLGKNRPDDPQIAEALACAEVMESERTGLPGGVAAEEFVPIEAVVADLRAATDPPDDAATKDEIAYVTLCCGREFLMVGGMAVAMETDPCRDGGIGSGPWSGEKLQDAADRINRAVADRIESGGRERGRLEAIGRAASRPVIRNAIEGSIAEITCLCESTNTKSIQRAWQRDIDDLNALVAALVAPADAATGGGA